MIAAVFPGQGSQKPGMGQELVRSHDFALKTFEEAGDAVGIDLQRLCFESDEDTLRQTQNTQIALFVTSVAAFRCLPRDIADNIGAMAGHSVGEYAALTCAGILDLSTGAKLVRRRGELMAGAKSGGMAAILGLERDALQAVCEGVDGIVVIANDNCPGQLVISGEAAAIPLACEAATAAGAKRALPLNVSGAFHSPLMIDAAQEMAQFLSEATWSVGHAKVYSNVTTHPESNWADLLEKQLSSPVRWTESIQNMVAEGTTTFVECGVGEVLSGMIKRIDRTVSLLRVNDDASLANTLGELG